MLAGVSFDADLSFSLILWEIHDNVANVMFMILWCNVMLYCNVWDYLWNAWGVNSFLVFFREGVLALYVRDFLPFVFLIPLFFSAPYHLGFGSVVILRELLFKCFSVNCPSLSVSSPRSRDIPGDRGVQIRPEELGEDERTRRSEMLPH